MLSAAQFAISTSHSPLVFSPGNAYKVLIDDEVASEGSLLEDFSPSVNQEIDGPQDRKLEYWVDEAQIRDPDPVELDDWDEDEPLQIFDEVVSFSS